MLEKATGNQRRQCHQVSDIVPEESQADGTIRLKGNDITQLMFLTSQDFHFETISYDVCRTLLSDCHPFRRRLLA